MRIINNIIFFLALVGGIIFAVVNWSLFQIYTDLDLFYGTVRLPTNIIVFLAYLALIFSQWLAAQGAWVLRHRKLDRAEKETVRLKARLYDLTEGSWLDEIRDTITETRKELREDIKWLATQPHYQLAEGQLERPELPPLLKEGGKKTRGK